MIKRANGLTNIFEEFIRPGLRKWAVPAGLYGTAATAGGLELNHLANSGAQSASDLIDKTQKALTVAQEQGGQLVDYTTKQLGGLGKELIGDARDQVINPALRSLELSTLLIPGAGAA